MAGVRVARSTDEAPHGLLVVGGTVWDEHAGKRADVRVLAGTIVELGDLAPAIDEEVLDATGLDVLPGMIDVHVHAGDRIGRFELADTWDSASRAALANGVTTLAGFATQQPRETLAAAVARAMTTSAGAGCEVRFHITPTAWPWNWDEVGDLIGRGFTTVKLYTTYCDAGLFTPYERLEASMRKLAALGATVLVHCEDDAVLAAASAALEPGTPFSHTSTRPESAEVEAVRRIIELAERTGCRTHVVHVSSALAAERIVAARGRAPVTCEAALHYLLLDERTLRGPQGHRWLCTPPLRSETCRARLEELAVNGAFDLFATDHCAFLRCDKDSCGRDVSGAPFGIAGLGALVPLAFELLVTRHARPLSELVRSLAANPARLLGLYPRKGVIATGSDADLVVVDTHGPVRSIVSTLADSYETYPGRTTTFTVRHMVRAGRLLEATTRAGG
jgi:dihydropyrimidinase